MPVLQNETLLRKEVASVTFSNTLEQAGEDAWDISEAKDTSRVKSMEGMFWGCRFLQELDVTGFDTSKAKNMENMFAECDRLDTLDISTWDTDSVTNVTDMFTGCIALDDIGKTEGNVYDAFQSGKKS